MYTNSATEQLVKPNRVLFNQEQETEIFLQWRGMPDGRARERLYRRLILNYGPIVNKIVRSMDGYLSGSTRIERDDLIAEGLEGLVDAANRFDLNLGWRFSTFAQTWVRGVIYAYIAKNYFMVNPCSNGTRKKMFFRLRSMIYRMNQAHGESFEITSEMAEMFATSFQTTVDEVMNMLVLFRAPQESLSETISSNRSKDETTEMTREDMLVDPRNAYDEFNAQEQNSFRREVILKAVQKLRPRERTIYLSQMMAEDGQGSTLQDLGKQYGISKERVRQLRERAEARVEIEIRAMIGRGEVTRTDLFG